MIPSCIGTVIMILTLVLCGVQQQFPLLSNLARIVFCSPCCMRGSVAGNILTPKRASLNPAKVEQLITVKCKMQLLRQFGINM